MSTQENSRHSKRLSLVRKVRLNSPEWDDDVAQPRTECEVVEYDAENGQAQWDDSVFVQDFTDSVLSTSHVPLQGPRDDAQ